MKFETATIKELIEIVHYDDEADWIYKAAALSELMRRKIGR